jgi:hypothetical protein
VPVDSISSSSSIKRNICRLKRQGSEFRLTTPSLGDIDAGGHRELMPAIVGEPDDTEWRPLRVERLDDYAGAVVAAVIDKNEFDVFIRALRKVAQPFQCFREDFFFTV